MSEKRKEITTKDGLYTVEVWVNTESQDGAFEICGDDDSTEDDYSEGGLWFEGKELTDYDGVCALDDEVINILKEWGYDTSWAD
tara:strand:+ start:188 stop:439 length:252 start_codon:yes stop_codon:yes gene_type:complete